MSLSLQNALELAHARRFRESEQVLLQLLQRSPDNVRALHLMASIAEIEGKLEKALQVLRHAARICPSDFVVNAHLSALARGLGLIEESIHFGQLAAALRPDDPIILNDLAISYNEHGESERAEQCLRRALELKPDFAQPHNTLGLIAQQSGRLDEAVLHFEEFLRRDPKAALGYVNLLDSYAVRDADDPHIKGIERRLSENLGETDRMLLLFALTKAKADLGLKREALTTAISACKLKRARITYDEAATLRSFDHIRQSFSAEFMRKMEGSGFESAKPIFIVSMPRAGSTLVEQILSSCPSVFGGGELDELAKALSRETHDEPLHEFPIKSTPAALARIGKTYVDAISRRAPGASYVTDKMPANFFMVGLIRLALPSAKLIHVRRSPVDTCVSCFTRHFNRDQNHTYDLAEIGRYYRAYSRLMAHWREALPPGSMLDVRYEDLVNNFETEARRLVDFCGIPWDGSALRFHENPRKVTTHSVAQVRRPLYSTAIGKWTGCEDLLQPLLEALGDLRS